MKKNVFILIFFLILGISVKANNITFTPTSQSITTNSGVEIDATVRLNCYGSQPGFSNYFIYPTSLPDNGFQSIDLASGNMYVGDVHDRIFKFELNVSSTTSTIYAFRVDWYDEQGNFNQTNLSITVTYTFNDPDSDGDGVPDSQDDCPNQAGPASNNGCPEANCSITKVQSFKKNYASPTKLGFDWDNVGSNNGYVLQYRRFSVSSWSSVNLPQNTTDYIKENLQPESSYRFRIAAKCSNGNLGPWNNGHTTFVYRTYPDCPDSYTVPIQQQHPSYGNIRSTYIINAVNTINFSGSIDSNVKCYAGQSIILGQGFRMYNNSTFLAKIEDCSTNQYRKNENYEKLDEKIKIFLYPNPTKGQFTITCNKEVAHWEIRSKFGKLLNKNSVINSKEIGLSLYDYPSDIYFIKIKLKTGEIITKKIIKK